MILSAITLASTVIVHSSQARNADPEIVKWGLDLLELV